jgi:hypothetical protein
VATVDDVYNIAAAFLAASIEALNKTPMGAPERAFVSPGEPAMDCCDPGQLSVYTQTLAEANLAGGSGALSAASKINRGGLARAVLSIMIIRCVPSPTTKSNTITYPPPAALSAAAKVIDEDGWALWLGINYALKHGTLHKLCSGAERLGGTKLAQQGGCGGWVFTYRYPIAGGILGT